MFKKKAEEEKKSEKTLAAEQKSAEETVPSEEPKVELEKSGLAADANAGETTDGPASEQSEQANNSPKAEPDWKTLYAITLADFDNYKKRAARDREDVYRYAESDILKDILPTVDNLALALGSGKAEVANQDQSGQETASPLLKGVQMVYDGLLKALADHGAKPMEDLVGKDLDPNFHEAIATLPDAQIEEGKISNVAKTGWTLNDKLLRAAQVVVSAGKPA